jgi:hypothetical protein
MMTMLLEPKAMKLKDREALQLGPFVLVCGGELGCLDLPRGWVALDGAVQGPILGDDQDRWSFDHHAGCHRLITLATCEQIRLALCLGFYFNARKILVNDLDGDTLLSMWLIMNSGKANERTVRTLVRAVGTIDAHGPPGMQALGDHERAVADTFYQDAIGEVTAIQRNIREHWNDWPRLVKVSLDGITGLVNGDLPVREGRRDPSPCHDRSL